MENFYRSVGLIHGNWFGPNWCGGVYNPAGVDTMSTPAATTPGGSCDKADAIARYHDLALTQFTCNSLPYEYRLSHHRAADFNAGSYFINNGYPYSGAFLLFGHYTWTSVLRTRLTQRAYTIEETAVIVREFSSALNDAKTIYPSGVYPP